ncbi:kinase-like domain-containing protein [Lipomyces japonicus]|uniref:kinase-like domain-containing protein n=1 Tax=Lipomyces japonicus TaxID=56871 RepID=UPI0034CD2026
MGPTQIQGPNRPSVPVPHIQHELLNDFNPELKPKQNDINVKFSKPKEKASSLCKTPPTLIRGKNNGARFRRGNFLGEGGFARCFEVQNESGILYAAKTIAKASLLSTKTRNKLLGEIKIHQDMDHPNIVKFVECFEDDVNVYIILEVCSNNTLMDMHRRRKRFTEPETRYFLLQILGAVKYMHGRRVIHRDLKLGNIFLDKNMNVKIGDFGLAALLLSDSDRKKTICGTPNYIAPEVLFGKDDGHSFEVDLWSVGIILYAMLIGKPPFQSKDVDLIYKKIKAIEYVFPEGIEISDDAKDLIQSLLTKDPRARPSLDQIADHPFFHGEMPSRLPSTCIQGVPHWKNLTPALSHRNYIFVSGNAGIGPNSGNGELVTKNAKNPVSVLEVNKSSIPTTEEIQKGSGKILPDALSPKVSDENIRQIVNKEEPAHLATEIGQKKVETIAAIREEPVAKNTSTRAFSTKPNALLQDITHAVPENIQSSGNVRSYLAISNDKTAKLKEMIDILANALSGMTVSDKYNNQNYYPVYVSQWVDYSNKYGLGYQLSDGSSGVYFNDTTSLIVTQTEETFDYISRENDKARRRQFLLESFPIELKKKMYLVKHFRAYMNEHLLVDTTKVLTAPQNMACSDGGNVYMTDYLRTKQAIMFRLGNGNIQFNFLDHYKLILWNSGRRVTLVDAERNFIDMNITEFLGNCYQSTTVQTSLTTGRENGEQRVQRIEFAKLTLERWYQSFVVKGK